MVQITVIELDQSERRYVFEVVKLLLLGLASLGLLAIVVQERHAILVLKKVLQLFDRYLEVIFQSLLDRFKDYVFQLYLLLPAVIAQFHLKLELGVNTSKRSILAIAVDNSASSDQQVHHTSFIFDHEVKRVCIRAQK